LSSRSEAAQRWGSILVGAVVLVVVGWMTVEASGPPHLAKHDAGARDAAAEPTPAASAAAAGLFEGSHVLAADASAAPTTGDLDGGLVLSGLGLGDAGALLPTSAPRQVKIGVVLVTYAGAEGAPPNARSKQEALTIAERLAGAARSDFHQAVSEGDSGSSDDIGRIPRGVLDPRTEVAVFALDSGAVSEVLETPKGYWIVKRLD
jgi:hypothetical protein